MILLELAERVEALSGPSREMDLEIWIATNSLKERDRMWGNSWKRDGQGDLVYHFKDSHTVDTALRDGVPASFLAGCYKVPKLTASLDAAMTLVPADLGWSLATRDAGFDAEIWEPGENGRRWEARSATPAIALTAAALRARTQEDGQSPRSEEGAR